jgi:hypothetical protein
MNTFEITLRRPDSSIATLHRFVAEDEKTMQRKFDTWLIEKVILPANSDHKFLDIDDYIRLTQSDDLDEILEKINQTEIITNLNIQLSSENIIDWYGTGVYRVNYEFYNCTHKYIITPVYIPGGCRYWHNGGEGIYFIKNAWS